MLYRSKPQEVEAVQWTGENAPDVVAFVNPDPPRTPHNDRAWMGFGNRMRLLAGKDGAQGWVDVPVGHWIVRQPGDLSDHWPVDPDYFAAKYERDWQDR